MLVTTSRFQTSCKFSAGLYLECCLSFDICVEYTFAIVHNNQCYRHTRIIDPMSVCLCFSRAKMAYHNYIFVGTIQQNILT